MKLVVIESPLAGDFMRNRAYALWCMLDSAGRGEAPFASHLLYTQVLDDNNEADREFGIAAGLAWARCADVHAFYADLGWSPGMKRAHAMFDAHNPTVEVRHLPADMLVDFEAGRTPSTTPGFGLAEKTRPPGWAT